MLHGVRVRTLSRPIQALDIRALEECDDFTGFLASRVVLLSRHHKEKWQKQYVIPEHPDMLDLPHGAFKSVELADPSPDALPEHAHNTIKDPLHARCVLCRPPTPSHCAALLLFPRLSSH